MFHTRFLVEYLCIIFQLREALIYAYPSSMYRTLVLNCPTVSDGDVYWSHNGSVIKPKRGKFLIYDDSLEILDLREHDQGVYLCSPTAMRDEVLEHFNVTVKDPSERALQIHKDTVPISVSEEVRDKLYWHPKMKREPEIIYMDFEPVVLSVYFYVNSNHLHPDVRWLPPAHVNPFTNGIPPPQVVACDDLEETQRPMSGTCFRASLDVPILSYGGEFAVQIWLLPESTFKSGYSDPELRTTFRVLKNALHHFLSREELEDTTEIADSNHESFVFPELGIEDYPIIDELRNLKKSDPDHKHSSNQTADTELSHDMVETHSRREESLPVQSIPRLGTPTRPPSSSSSTPKQTKPSYMSTQIPDVTVSAFDPALDVHEGSSDLNCSILTPSTHPRLDFFVHHSKACIGANQTVDCRFFRIPIQLELWFLRPLQENTLTPQSCTEECNNLGCFERPQLLKKSHVQEYRFIRQPSRHIERSYQFDDSVAVTLISLGPEHSGLYLCKAGHIYRALTVEVRDCSASNLNFRPLILIILLLFTTAAMLSVPLVVCLRARRKPVIAVLSSSMFNLNSLPGLGTKKQTMISRWNKLYPPIDETTTHALLLGSAAKSWLLPTKQKQQPIIVPLKSHINRLRRKQSRVYRPAPRLVPLDPRWEVDRAQIEIGCVLGQGNFGIVYSGVVRGVLPGSRCSRKSSPARSSSNGLKQEVAIKTLKDDYTQEQLMDLLRELETMRLLDSHPHLIQLLGTCTQQGTPMILMEFAEHGNLRDYLRKNRPTLCDAIEPCILDTDADSSTTQFLGHELNVPMLLRFACHVADALIYFESLKMVHRDVAARNVLICAGFIAKLSDFGFSRVIENDYYVDINRDQVPYKWMAPECYETHRCTLKSDVWSFGILLWEMFSLGEVPYPGVSTADLPEWLAAGNRNTQPLLADVTLFNLMLRCWETEPDKRPGFQTILKELSCHWLGNPPRPQRQLSQDSGCCSESQSGQSSSLKDFIFTDVVNTNAPVASTKPVPPVRTCSLPHGGKPSTGYVEMRSSEYLEPRSALNLNLTEYSPV